MSLKLGVEFSDMAKLSEPIVHNMLYVSAQSTSAPGTGKLPKSPTPCAKTHGSGIAIIS
jgi:hypothetical protein